MATASTTAWVLHDLGLAAGFGGALFGKMELNPAVGELTSKKERGLVLDKAWSGFQAAHVVSLATVAATWLAGRTFLSGDFIGRDLRGLVVAKDVLVGAAVVSGIASSVTGAMLAREHEKSGGEPVADGNRPAPETPERVRILQQVTNTAGAINIGAMAAVIGVTTVLAMKAGRSSRWSFLSRFLP